jgi:hypothetical protein
MSLETPPAPRPHGILRGNEPPGVLCPGCQKQHIRLTIDQLLYSTGVRCDHCGLWLVIDKVNSRDAIESVQKLKDAKDAVNKFNHQP